MTQSDTTEDEPHAGGGIAVTVTDGRPGEKSPEETQTPHEPADGRSSDNNSGYSVTRRDVLVTSVAGYLFGGTGAVTAQENAEQTIEIALNDGVGSSHSRVPNHFRIGNKTSFTIDPSPELSGKLIDVFIEVKPASLSEKKYETIAEEAFIAGDSTYTFDTKELADEERDLTSHTAIELEDFRIDASLAELEVPENRYVVNSYDIRIRLVDEKGRVVTKQSQTFDVMYGLRGGPGVRFGYITGTVAPTDDFRADSEVK